MVCVWRKHCRGLSLGCVHEKNLSLRLTPGGCWRPRGSSTSVCREFSFSHQQTTQLVTAANSTTHAYRLHRNRNKANPSPTVRPCLLWCHWTRRPRAGGKTRGCGAPARRQWWWWRRVGARENNINFGRMADTHTETSPQRDKQAQTPLQTDTKTQTRTHRHTNTRINTDK